MSDYLYIRSLRKVDFTVFGVDTDQKNFYDKVFNTYQPFSSGQQVKHSIVNDLLNSLNMLNAPLQFNYQTDGGKLKQKEITQPCDPSYFDQLIRGWMSTPSKKDGSDNSENKEGFKRRSPFSISAMTPIHPLLASLVEEKILTFDRSDSNAEKIVIKNDKGDVMSEDDVKTFLLKSNANISKRNLVSGKKRANGLFKSDISIDLRKLFRVSLNLHDIEISEETIEKLKGNGWSEVETKQGRFLELPKKFHEEYAKAIAWSLINWKITSNQSRTFDYMSVLSIAVSNRADEVANTIRGEIYEDGDKIKAKLVVDENCGNTNIYSTKLLNGYVLDSTTSHTAIDDAVENIKTVILEYYK